MTELQYITMDTNSWINTGIRANPQSVIYAKLSPQSVAASIDWATFWGANTADDAGDTYQLRQVGTSQVWKPQIGGTWRSGGVGTFVYGNDYEITFDVPNSLVTINNDTYTGSQCSWSSPAANPAYPIYVGANNKANSGYRASGARWYAFYIIQSGVKVIDLIPAINENNVVCFYDKVSGNYFYNAGSGTFTAGPAASSIIVSASKTVLAASGETISIYIETQNAWTATEPYFFTLSQTAGTGNSTITLTAPANTGATYRSGSVIVTDSVTGDYGSVTIKQKYIVNGQPFYLGADEIAEIYLGADTITEAYLGDVLVFSSTSPTPPTPPSPTGGTRTIRISNIPTPPFGNNGTVGRTDVSITDENENYAYLTLNYRDPEDETSYEENIATIEGFTASYASGYFEVEGEWGDDITITYDYIDIGCEIVPSGYETEQPTFVNNVINTSFPTTETDLECDCMNNGGEWDSENQECIYADPCEGMGEDECQCTQNGGTWVVPEEGDPYCEGWEDPCIEDPCNCDPNPDECHCIQDGGTWDSENQQCYY